MDANETAAWIHEVTGADVLGAPERVQTLWSGYGAIERFRLDGAPPVILKRVEGPSGPSDHPRGWASDFADRRKRRSYAVERTFYREYAGETVGEARLPRLLGEEETEAGGVMLLEDLDAAGFPARRTDASDADIRACLRWLAAFHARFLGREPTGLWERGTYWHLATRPDELAAIEDDALREAAPRIDAVLGQAEHRTLVHGDAKLANFCFPGAASPGESAEVAAVDLQYVGGGVGVQDVAYFLGSCLGDAGLEAHAQSCLDVYCEKFGRALEARGVVSAPVLAEGRALWPYAWADFHRFLAGWAPGHWKLSAFSEAMTRRVL